MNRFVITAGTTKYTRISKRKARTLFEQGKAIQFCPVKLRPGLPFCPDMMFQKNQGMEFETALDFFEHYNCNSNETGYYAAFYITEAME